MSRHRRGTKADLRAAPATLDAMPSAQFARIFDASNFPDSRDRVAAWRDSFSLTVDVEFEDREIDDFSGAISYHSLGVILLVQRRYTSHTVIRSRDTIARTGSEKVIFHYFLQGGTVGLAGARAVAAAAGDCFVYDTAGTVRIRMLTGRFIGLVIPRRLLTEKIGRLIQLHGLTLSSDSPSARIVGSMLEKIAEQADHLGAASSRAFGAALIGMIAASIDSTGDPAKGVQRGRNRQPQTLPIVTPARLQRYIDRHAADPAFTPEVLASAFNLSRTALYRKFQGSAGVAGAIRAKRAALAFEALTTTNNMALPLSVVARNCGYESVVAMRRGVHALYHTTPAKLRKNGRGLSERAAYPKPSSLIIGALYDEMS